MRSILPSGHPNSPLPDIEPSTPPRHITYESSTKQLTPRPPAAPSSYRPSPRKTSASSTYPAISTPVAPRQPIAKTPSARGVNPDPGYATVKTAVVKKPWMRVRDNAVKKPSQILYALPSRAVEYSVSIEAGLGQQQQQVRRQATAYHPATVSSSFCEQVPIANTDKKTDLCYYSYPLTSFSSLCELQRKEEKDETHTQQQPPPECKISYPPPRISSIPELVRKKRVEKEMEEEVALDRGSSSWRAMRVEEGGLGTVVEE